MTNLTNTKWNDTLRNSIQCTKGNVLLSISMYNVSSVKYIFQSLHTHNSYRNRPYKFSNIYILLHTCTFIIDLSLINVLGNQIVCFLLSSWRFIMVINHVRNIQHVVEKKSIFIRKLCAFLLWWKLGFLSLMFD